VGVIRSLLLALALLIVVPSTASAAWPTPIWSGPESAYAEFNGGTKATADALLDDVWPARSPRKPVKLDWPLTWTEDPYQDAYWRFFYYSLRPTSSLLWAYATTKDARYLKRLRAILSSYAAHDATRSYDRLTFDNPHAAAYRAMVLVNTVVKLKRWAVLPAALERDLTESLRRLGAFLELPRHFESDHNHGYNEALALALIGRNFPQFPESARWSQLGADRLLLMLDTTIDQDGVEVENSPFYHVYVLGMVAETATWAAKYEPRIAPAYTTAARKMLRYAAYVTQPDGTLPMLGATATTNVPAQDPAVYGPLRGTEPAFDWVFTAGATGRPPTDGAALFPVSGLYVLRAPLADAPKRTDQTFVTFDAGVYRTSHSHLDALSITLFSDGKVVLPEAGLFTYDAGPEFDYFHGTRGHNTVLVDGTDQAAGDAVPGPSGNLPGGSWASGTSRLNAGVAHNRTVVVLRQDLVLALDALVSADEHDYAQLWHLPAASRVRTLSGGTLVSDSAGKPTLSIVQAGGSAVSQRTVTGATEPIQGWTSHAYGFKTPSPTLEFHRQSRSGRLATLLASGPHAGRLARVTQEALPGGRRVAVCASEGHRYTLTVQNEGTPRQTVRVHNGCTL
jgi:hypothetical protein